MSEKKRVKHYVSKKTGKVFPAEEWTVGEPVDGKRSIPLDRFPLDIIYHDEKKREPLLSEFGIIEWAQEKALDMAQADDADPNWVSAYSAGLRSGMRGGRDYYERLIDEGKLRVVEEVVAKGQNNVVGLMVTDWWCSGCSRRLQRSDNFCPGCGGRIKKT